jgi:delta24(24(1))-sterol reductase
MVDSQLRSRNPAKANDSNEPEQQVSSASNVDDVAHELEFGGAPGTLAMMIGFPLLFYYLYVCIFFNHGKLDSLPFLSLLSLSVSLPVG